MRLKAYSTGVFKKWKGDIVMMDLNVRNIKSPNKQIKQNNEEGINAIYSPTEVNNEKYHQKLPVMVVVMNLQV